MSSNGFDLDAQLELAKQEDEGTDVHIHGVDEEPLYYQGENGERQPVIIRVAGAHSQRYRRAEERIRKRKLKPNKFTGELIHTDNVEKVAECTLSWKGIHAGGEPVEMTIPNARQIYKRAPWVLDQILEAMNEPTNFFVNGSKPE